MRCTVPVGKYRKSDFAKDTELYVADTSKIHKILFGSEEKFIELNEIQEVQGKVFS